MCIIFTTVLTVEITKMPHKPWNWHSGLFLGVGIEFFTLNQLSQVYRWPSLVPAWGLSDKTGRVSGRRHRYRDITWVAAVRNRTGTAETAKLKAPLWGAIASPQPPPHGFNLRCVSLCNATFPTSLTCHQPVWNNLWRPDLH